MAKESKETTRKVKIPYELQVLFFDTACQCLNGDIESVDMNHTRDNTSISLHFSKEDGDKVTIEISASAQ